MTERVEKLEQEVSELIQQHENLENRFNLLEATVTTIRNAVRQLTQTVEEIIGYLTHSPYRLRKQMICGYMEENSLQEHDALGLSCQIIYNRCRCTVTN